MGARLALGYRAGRLSRHAIRRRRGLHHDRHSQAASDTHSDRRAVLLGLPAARRRAAATAWSPRIRRASASASRAACSTATALRCPTPWSRSGRQTATGATITRPTNATCPSTPILPGLGAAAPNEDGAFWFETIKPGPVPYDDTLFQAPHINVTVFARGLLNHLLTRLYFADDPRTANDPILALVPPERRSTLLAQPSLSGNSSRVHVYRFDIVLQGDKETVFFNV